MAKRAATSVLDPDNLDKEEEEAEEPGVFQTASSEVLQARVIKTAKRRIRVSDNGSESKPSPFSTFTGFGKATSTSNVGSPFSFLNQNKSKADDKEKNGRGQESLLNSTKDSPTQLKSLTSSSFQSGELQKNNFSNFSFDSNKNPPVSTDSTFKPFEHIFKSAKSQNQENDKKSQNLEALKDLNLSCSNWIKEHLEKNPYCILTPIFKDYQKHLIELNLDVENKKEDDKIESEKSSTIENSNSETEKGFSSNKEETTIQLDQENKKDGETDKSNAFKFGEYQPMKPFNVQFSSVNTTSESSSPAPFSLNQIAAKPINQNESNKDDEEESEEPPKVDFVPVIEEDSTFVIKCKVFVKKDDNFVSRGVGTLCLKPVKDGKLTQLVVRAHTSLGNILLNILLLPGMPIQKAGKNHAMIVCLPTPDSKPPPVPVLIKVKTSEECDDLIRKLEEGRGS